MATVRGGPIEALAGNLAANLRYIRERRGLTQVQLARLANLPRSTVSQVETGADTSERMTAHSSRAGLAPRRLPCLTRA